MPDGMVPRTELLSRLDKHRRRPLTLVSAPAGYGKSVLISSWLEASDCPGAWISLDKDDNDLRMFLTCFVTAVNRLFPDAGKKTRSMVEAADLAPASVLAQVLINDLHQIEQPFILVLDDYYFIQQKVVRP